MTGVAAKEETGKEINPFCQQNMGIGRHYPGIFRVWPLRGDRPLLSSVHPERVKFDPAKP